MYRAGPCCKDGWVLLLRQTKPVPAGKRSAGCGGRDDGRAGQGEDSIEEGNQSDANSIVERFLMQFQKAFDISYLGGGELMIVAAIRYPEVQGPATLKDK